MGYSNFTKHTFSEIRTPGVPGRYDPGKRGASNPQNNSEKIKKTLSDPGDKAKGYDEYYPVASRRLNDL